MKNDTAFVFSSHNVSNYVFSKPTPLTPKAGATAGGVALQAGLAAYTSIAVSEHDVIAHWAGASGEEKRRKRRVVTLLVYMKVIAHWAGASGEEKRRKKRKRRGNPTVYAVRCVLAFTNTTPSSSPSSSPSFYHWVRQDVIVHSPKHFHVY